MTYPTVTRGRITVIETGITKNLFFNPSEITDLKSINWGQLDVPGASHPIYQYGTGGERSITFEMYLDGDRGRFDRLDSQDDISVESEIKFYRSLVYPTKYNDTFEAVYPHTLLFSFGDYIDNLHCIMKAAPSVRVLHFTPKLKPVRATIAITLAELVDKGQTSEDIYPTVHIGNQVIQLDPTYITASIGKGGGGGHITRLGVTNIEGRVPKVFIGDAVLKSGGAAGGGDQSGAAFVTKNGVTLDPITLIGQQTGKSNGFAGGGGGFGGAGATGKWGDGSDFALRTAPFHAAPAEKSSAQMLPSTTITARRVQTLPPTTIKASARPTQLAPTTVYSRKRK